MGRYKKQAYFLSISNHIHDNDHSHTNKAILDTIDNDLIDKWNTVNIKSDTGHTHDERYYTETEIDTKLSNKSDISHNHDGAYYKQSEIDIKLGNKSDKIHTHTEADITDLDKYTKLEVDTKLNSKSDTGHIHDKRYYTETEIDTKLSNKSDISHNHDGAYYKQSEIDIKLGNKSDKIHTHTEEDITDLDKYTKLEVDTKLNSKSDTGHIHDEHYTKLEVDTKLNSKSDKSHTHSELHTHTNKEILDKLIETEPNINYDISNLQYIEDIKNGYTEGHAHSNLDTLKGITDIKVNGWDSSVVHISDDIKHITSIERIKWNEVDNKSDISHNHDITYSKLSHTHLDKADKTYVDTELGNKSDKIHTHTEEDITDLDKYTKLEVDTKLNSKSDTGHTHLDKADKTYVDTELENKADNTTVSYHTNNTDIHVTLTKKNEWDSKAEGIHEHTTSEITDFPSSLPANGGFADGFHMIDTRNIDDTPQELLARKTTGMFKYRTSVGNPPVGSSATYVFIINIIGWNATEGSGGWPIQIAVGKEGLAIRQGIDDSTWGQWTKIDNQPTVGTVKPTDGSIWYEVI